LASASSTIYNSASAYFLKLESDDFSQTIKPIKSKFSNALKSRFISEGKAVF
jgi:hypothetical protein|tara:strand:+ start:24743 stop:24898 length:156 start_codon:yes stop_codon:yes gene_type:complete